MAREINPKETKRAAAFELWMEAPMPMVTLFKTLDVTRLARLGRRPGYRFNAMLCWCVGKAASQSEDFYLLPVGGKMVQYDRLAVDVVVTTRDGGISTCDVPFSDDYGQFARDYDALTEKVHDTGRAYDLGGGYMVIGTSALAGYEIDGAVNIYAGCYNNPFLVWGKYRRGVRKTVLPVSFQFHHTQMDGVPAAQFLEQLQRETRGFKPS